MEQYAIPDPSVRPICDLIEERAPGLHRAKQLAPSPIRCKLELQGVPGADAKGFSLWVRTEPAQGQIRWAVSSMLPIHLPPLRGNGMSVQQWWLSHCLRSRRWVLCSEARCAACTSWFAYVKVILTSSLVGYVPVLSFRVQSL